MVVQRKSRSKDSWETAFPGSQDNEPDRLRFMARIGYIAIAHYLLYRKLVPLGVYKRRRVGDIILYCFDASKRWGEKLSQMMAGLKDAVEKKYVESALIVINEGNVASEVFIVRFCYEKEHAIKIGHPLVYLQFKDEPTFRKQTKHMIKKINAVTKRLGDLKDGVFPELKLTYVPGTPEDYEPPHFVRADGTYTFAKKPMLYNYGSITTNSTAIAFQLKSIYLTNDVINDLDDALYDEAGLVDKQFVDPKDVSGDVFTDESESPLHIPQSPLQLEVPRSEEVFQRHYVDLKASQTSRNVLKSPEDQLIYE